MQWDHLRTFEAVARLGSLTAASRALGVSQSTVSRHMSALEAHAGSPLIVRTSPVSLTQRGAALRAAIKPMVTSALSAQAALEDTPELRGQVTVATVGEMVRWLLIPRLPAFYAAFPHLRLVLLADNRVNSLAAGEADIALRMARPERGDLVARKMRTMSYGFFAAPSLSLNARTPWLGLGGSLENIPEQRHAARVFAPRPPRLLVEDVEALGLAVAAGLGVAILPHRLAEKLSGVEEIAPAHVGIDDDTPLPTRDFWMVVHSTRRDLPKVRAVIEWLFETRDLDPT